MGRLITSCDFDLWECNYGVVEKVPGGFDQYKDEVIKTLDERQAKIERDAAKRAENRKKERELRKQGIKTGGKAAKEEEAAKKADEEKKKPAIDFMDIISEGKKKKKPKKEG